MRRRDQGSALIEAAFVLPVFALLLCGSLDIASMLRLNQVATSAARAGIHRALQSDPHSLDLTAIEAAAMADAGTGFTARAERVCACAEDEPAVSCAAAKCGASRVSYIRVETRAELKPFIRYPGMGSAFHIQSAAMARVE